MLEVLEETLAAARVIKVYTTEAAEQKRFRAVNRRLYKELKPKVAVNAAIGPAVEAMGITAALVAAPEVSDQPRISSTTLSDIPVQVKLLVRFAIQPADPATAQK